MHPQCPWCAVPITAQRWLMSAVPFHFACTQCRQSIPLKRWVVVVLSIYIMVMVVTIGVVIVQTLPDRTRMLALLALTVGMFTAGGIVLESILLRLDPVQRT